MVAYLSSKCTATVRYIVKEIRQEHFHSISSLYVTKSIKCQVVSISVLSLSFKRWC